MNDSIITAIILIIILLLVLYFTVFRTVMLWYFKIDVRIKLQERNNELLEKLLGHYGIKISNDYDGTITVKHIKTGKRVTVPLKTWEKMKQEYGEDAFEIL